MTTTATSERLLNFEIAHNVRHMGGYATRDRRETRPSVIRAASLHRLTDAGVDSFVAAGIRTVIDLRSDRERDEFRTPSMEAQGVTHIFAPVFSSDASPVGLGEGFRGYAPIYQSFLETGGGAFRTVIEALAESDGGVLFHCAAGKDRTGVAAALLLELAGVADADIIEDYSQSAGLLREAFRDQQLTPEQRERFGRMSDETRALLLSSEPPYMVETLSFVRGRWGSARGYFRAQGVPEETISRARMRMLW